MFREEETVRLLLFKGAETHAGKENCQTVLQVRVTKKSYGGCQIREPRSAWKDYTFSYGRAQEKHGGTTTAE